MSDAAPAISPTLALSEHQSKEFLRPWGIPVTRETLATSPEEAALAAQDLGFPVALKACARELAHKSDLGLVELNLAGPQQVIEAGQRLLAAAPAPSQLLVQEMVPGPRELIAGLVRDAHYGPAVMLGLGGVAAEALNDVTFRVAPISLADALAMMDELSGRRILEAFRGQPAVDRQALAELLVNLGRIGLAEPRVLEIDLNPLKFRQGRPVAVDALVVMQGGD